jgi:DNA-binding transcriptional MerR regulator
MTTATQTGSAPAARLLTIGAVCTRLRDEFPDISISKIRYLEDQGLLTPRRTRGGYRLFSADDVERLQTILRLQRDEFLPLRVIREALESPAGAAERARRRAPGLGESEGEIDLDELCDRASIGRDFARQLEEFSLLQPRLEGGERLYRETDAEIATACGKLSRYGIDARHLRTFRTAADRQAALLEQLVAPALRARNPERRKAGLEDLRSLAAVSQELSQLLFWRDLRHVAER